ncbi:hypothetical protein ABZP36_033233 [Zizania latifolia]
MALYGRSSSSTRGSAIRGARTWRAQAAKAARKPAPASRVRTSQGPPAPLLDLHTAPHQRPASIASGQPAHASLIRSLSLLPLRLAFAGDGFRRLHCLLADGGFSRGRAVQGTHYHPLAARSPHASAHLLNILCCFPGLGVARREERGENWLPPGDHEEELWVVS